MTPVRGNLGASHSPRGPLVPALGGLRDRVVGCFPVESQVMSRKRVASLILGVLFVATTFIAFVLPVLTRPRTYEGQVRAVFERMVEAVLDEDFEGEWGCFSASNRATWAGQLAGWRALDPADRHWADLRRVHGLERSAILRMDALEFFVACRSGRARLDPEWWSSEQAGLRTLPRGKFNIGEDGIARLSFAVDIDPDINIEEIMVEFEREGGRWRLKQVATLAMTLNTLAWREPELELAWAKGVTSFILEEVGSIVNLLSDGKAIVSEVEVGRESLTTLLVDPPDPEKLLAFRCDRRVPYAEAALWLRIVLESGRRPVALAVTSSPEKKCRPRQEAGDAGLCGAESRLDLLPPGRTVDPAKITAVIDIGPDPIGDDGRAALATGKMGTLVLLNPSPDVSWDAVVRVLAVLDLAGVEQVLLAAPGEEQIEGGASLSNHRPLATHPAAARILGNSGN